MRLLKSGIPRAFASHTSADGRLYLRVVRSLQRQHPTLPDSAYTTLREVGRLSVELSAMGQELEKARRLNRRRDTARLRRQMVPMRTQLLTLERRLEELAASRPGQSTAQAIASHPEVQ